MYYRYTVHLECDESTFLCAHCHHKASYLPPKPKKEKEKKFYF